MRTAGRTLLATVLILAAGSGGRGLLARDLTLADRVEAERSIQRVYYAHQIGTHRPFGEAVPYDVLERRVLDDLAKSDALE
ncbi:MAG TPA: hypothetical protein VNI57_09490, partial [Candidatus Saccharimonadales bacterium]|nr:hypothetical protein [Candidatus Saccharimonadales bacterium]